MAIAERPARVHRPSGTRSNQGRDAKAQRPTRQTKDTGQQAEARASREPKANNPIAGNGREGAGHVQAGTCGNPTMNTQSDLFNTRPRELIVQGQELLAVVPEIESQGGHVEGMEQVCRCNGKWRLRVHWPDENRAGKVAFPKRSPFLERI